MEAAEEAECGDCWSSQRLVAATRGLHIWEQSLQLLSEDQLVTER